MRAGAQALRSAGGLGEEREERFVAFVTERWLCMSPQGRLVPGSGDAKRAVVALTEGWSAAVVHMLAREPQSLRELARSLDREAGEIAGLLFSMRAAALTQSASTEDGEEIHGITDWLRAGLAPLIAAARAERRQMVDGAAPIEALDIEAGLRLAVPLLDLPEELSGVCRLGINPDGLPPSPLSGITVRVERGSVVSCRAGLGGPADSWAAAPAGAWLDTVIEPNEHLVRTGGNRWLAEAILEGLHRALFGFHEPESSPFPR